MIDVRLYTVNDGDDDKQPPLCEQFQIVLRRYADASHVVHGFDLALSGMVYTADPDIVWCTPWAMCTLATRKMLYDHSSLSSTAEKRYVKYARRFGVDLVVPDLEQRGVDIVMRDLKAMTDVYADLSALSAVGLDDPPCPASSTAARSTPGKRRAR